MSAAASRLARPVQIELDAAAAFAKRGDFSAGFRHLERAHVLSQNSTYEHVRVHWRMLLSGVHRRDWHEMAGQVFRILGAATKTVFGLVPIGNTGGVNVSPFRKMPIPNDLAVHLAKKPKPLRLRSFVIALCGALALAAMAFFDAAPPRDERIAFVDGHRVAFRVIGSGRPAIVMISGLGTGMATFDDVAAELAKTRTVILYDRAGYGASERSNGPRDAVAAERELSGVLAQSGVAGPYVLSGHSLGGLIAEYYAARHSADVSGLILEDSRTADFSRRCVPVLGASSCLPSAWIAWFFASGAADEAAALGKVTDQVEGVAPLTGKPVLVLSQPVTKSKDASFGSLWTEAQADLAARYPGSLHLSAAAGGHDIHHDQRKWFLASVQEFLRRMN